MALDVDAAALLVYRAAWMKDSGAARVTREAAMAKLFATDRAQEVIDKAVQLHGGDGVRRGHIVESLYREIRALRIYEGASDVQKVVIAREMARDFTVLIAAQPTRGVDVGAIEFIHDQLRRARDAGKAILLVSADLVEVLALGDRVAVMYGGRFATVVPRAEASADRLGPYMTGAAREGAA